MQDVRNEIKLLEEKRNDSTARNGLFGNILKTVTIQNIRAINTTIDFTGDDGVEALHKVPYLRAARELSSSVKTNKDIILVEDTVAQIFLTEILRRHNRTLLEQSSIVPIGNTDDVQRMVNSFKEQGVRAIGVRDPDIGENMTLGLLSLPGDKAPEALLLDSDNLDRAESFVNGIKDAFHKAKVQGHGLQGSKWSKKVFEALPNEAGLEAEQLADRLTLAWFSKEANNEAARALVKKMKSCFEANECQ